jgi:hypothetical protein
LKDEEVTVACEPTMLAASAWEPMVCRPVSVNWAERAAVRAAASRASCSRVLAAEPLAMSTAPMVSTTIGMPTRAA